MQEDYTRIEKLIHYIDQHSSIQPALEELAEQVQLSPFHLQKLFKRWVGVSPKQFLKLATLRKARQYLNTEISTLEASERLGLSSASRLYDHFVTIDAVTPGEFKTRGENLHLNFGSAMSPCGNIFVAWTDRGIHQLYFSDDTRNASQELKLCWPRASLKQNQAEAKSLVTSIFYAKQKQELTLRPHGTNFQTQVWKALLSIPPGRCVSYGELAKLIGKSSAARAVGSAVGSNSIAWLIPCHRVIQATGVIGNYRWGETRKRILLAREFSIDRGV